MFLSLSVLWVLSLLTARYVLTAAGNCPVFCHPHKYFIFSSRLQHQFIFFNILHLFIFLPVLLNIQPVYIPMATTEGCLVASTNRGCKAMYVPWLSLLFILRINCRWRLSSCPFWMIWIYINSRAPPHIPNILWTGCPIFTLPLFSSAAGGCHSVLLKDAITRAPCLRLPSAMRAAAVKRWVETPENYALVEVRTCRICNASITFPTSTST